MFLFLFLVYPSYLVHQWSNFEFCWTETKNLSYNHFCKKILLEVCLSCLGNPYLVVHWISVESVLQSHSETVVVRAVQCMSRSLPLLVDEPNLNKLWISLASTVVICSCNFFRNWIGTNCTNYKYFASIVIFTNSSVVQWTLESVKIFL